jgi:hypothetical protein
VPVVLVDSNTDYINTKILSYLSLGAKNIFLGFQSTRQKTFCPNFLEELIET